MTQFPTVLSLADGGSATVGQEVWEICFAGDHCISIAWKDFRGCDRKGRSVTVYRRAANSIMLDMATPHDADALEEILHSSED